MNVVFRSRSPEMDKKFCAEASAAGLLGLAGHRSVGGMRASLYNAVSVEDVEALVEFLREFEETDDNRRPLGSLPVVVVSSGPIASDTDRASRDTAGAQLDFLSSNTRHIEYSNP